MEPDPIKKAINDAYQFCEEQQRLLESGLITEAEWFENNRRHFTGSYLAQDDPRAQSGHGGDERRYRYTQEMILQAIHKSGTFLDVGCANGFLMESLFRWLADAEYRLEFYGLDISPELLDLAKRRLPQWKERIFEGNALYWTPESGFDFVCVRELDYAPKARRREFLAHLLKDCTAENGRLILGPSTEERAAPGLKRELEGWGYAPVGQAVKAHQERPELERRLYWFDKSDAGANTI